MSDTPNLHLYAWDRGDDPYEHDQLSENFYTIDGHDHTPGRGARIVTEALADSAVQTVKIADKAVTQPKLADGIIGPNQLALHAVVSSTLDDGAVTTRTIADNAVTFEKLALNVRPVGEVMAWWRPSSTTPIPDGWEVADGSVVADHDFPFAGPITLPNLQNKFILGAATGGTGTGPATPPDIGQGGGSNLANLSHTHQVPHSHTVPAHHHTVRPHAHVLKAHTHTVAPHAHVVDNHTHLISSHTHSVPGHVHDMDHFHSIPAHRHGIDAGGSHIHDFSANLIVGSRVIPAGGLSNPDPDLLHTVVPGGQDSGHLDMHYSGTHDHGGNTRAGSDFNTNGINRTLTGITAQSTDPSGAYNSGGSAPNTNGVGLTTNAQPLTTDTGTENTTVDTLDTQPFATSTDTPNTTTALSNIDIRPSFVGLLYLIKVKN